MSERRWFIQHLDGREWTDEELEGAHPGLKVKPVVDAKGSPGLELANKFGTACIEWHGYDPDMQVVWTRGGGASGALPDAVSHPAHYETGAGFECIDVLMETQGAGAVEGFCLCNAMKYLYRHRMKGGDEDVQKAVWYLTKYLELREVE